MTKKKQRLKIELNSEGLKAIEFIAIHTAQFIFCQFNRIFYCYFFFNSKYISNEWNKKSLNWCIDASCISLWYGLPPLFDCARGFFPSVHVAHILGILFLCSLQCSCFSLQFTHMIWIETFIWSCAHNAVLFLLFMPVQMNWDNGDWLRCA